MLQGGLQLCCNIKNMMEKKEEEKVTDLPRFSLLDLNLKLCIYDNTGLIIRSCVEAKGYHVGVRKTPPEELEEMGHRPLCTQSSIFVCPTFRFVTGTCFFFFLKGGECVSAT